MNAINKKTLEIGFWFGMNISSENEQILTSQINFDGNGYFFSDFERDYEFFKQMNPNPEVPYKDCIDNEECFIFFPEPVGTQLTTINEVRLIALSLESVNSEISELDKKIEALEKEQKEFINNVFNNPDYSDMEQVSIREIFNPLQIEMIEYLYNLSIKDKCSYQKLLKGFFETFKEDLNDKGFDYSYLSYIVSNSIEQESCVLSFAA
jgi:hypothetical protein